MVARGGCTFSQKWTVAESVGLGAFTKREARMRYSPRRRKGNVCASQGRNWRPHFVASVAALLSRDRADHASVLWRTFDDGSWVAPQIAVVLYLSDRGFLHEAKRRVLCRCRVTSAPDLDAFAERSLRAKTIASLLRVMSLVACETDWVALQLEQ